MQHLVRYAKSESVRQVTGVVLAGNTTMIEMARQLGFEVKYMPGDQTEFEMTLSTETMSQPPLET